MMSAMGSQLQNYAIIHRSKAVLTNITGQSKAISPNRAKLGNLYSHASIVLHGDAIMGCVKDMDHVAICSIRIINRWQYLRPLTSFES